MLAPRIFFFAALGDRRPHLSQRGADDYDEGVRRFQRGEPAPALETPQKRGWRDAAAQAAEATDTCR